MLAHVDIKARQHLQDMDFDTKFNVAKRMNPEKEILLKYNKIVFIGCSRNENKDAHTIPKSMKEYGYDVICVNPFAEERILGAPTYKEIADVPDEYLEVVCVFRPSEEIPAIVDKIIEIGKVPKVFWMQEGITSKYARERLEPLGVAAVEDSCIMRKYIELLVDEDPVYDAVLRFARQYAKAQGYALNPDPEKLDRVVEGLAHNQKNYGFRYCPCRPLSDNPKEDAKKICPCFWHRDEVKRDGRCHCSLFWDPKKLNDPHSSKNR